MGLQLGVIAIEVNKKPPAGHSSNAYIVVIFFPAKVDVTLLEISHGIENHDLDAFVQIGIQVFFHPRKVFLGDPGYVLRQVLITSVEVNIVVLEAVIDPVKLIKLHSVLPVFLSEAVKKLPLKTRRRQQKEWQSQATQQRPPEADKIFQFTFVYKSRAPRKGKALFF